MSDETAKIVTEIMIRSGNISQSELARRLGVTKGLVSQWRKGADIGKKNARKVIDLAKNLGINARALEIEVRPGLILLDALPTDREIPRMRWDQLTELHAPDKGKKARKGAELEASPLIFIGVGGDVPEDAVAASVADDSMEPDLHAGDLVIFARSVKPRDTGDLVVALVDEEVVLREYKSRGRNRKGEDVFDLISPSAEVETITGTSSKNVKILGTVVESRLKRRPD